MEEPFVPFPLERYEEILALWRACPGIGLSAADEWENLALFLERNPGLSFAALEGERVVGTVLCGHDGRRGYLYHLAVRPDRRRRGLARALVERALAGLAAQGVAKCHLMIVVENDSAREFYKRTGWVLREDLDIMSRVLEHRPDGSGG